MTDHAQPTVLISSAGRRVELLRAFRHTVESFWPADQAGTGKVLAVDCSWYSSAFHAADEAFLVPRCTEPDFIPRMVELCASQQVDLVVPTIDPELPVYADAVERFRAADTTVAISSPNVIAIAGDKVRTHDWLTDAGFPTVQQGSVADVYAEPRAWTFPLMVKPRFGSASVGVTKVDDVAALEHVVAQWSNRAGSSCDPSRDLVVQSVAQGVEYTVDVLVARDGDDAAQSALAAVPRRRIEVRAGEVSKGVTVHLPLLIELAQKVCTALPGAFGPLNVQMFYDEKTGSVAIIELNARFGGGYPLSFKAGADFPRALLQEALGMPITASLLDWRDGLVMLRYDAAVFVEGHEARSWHSP